MIKKMGPGTGHNPQAEVVFIADDFGLDGQTNEAVIRSYQEGALHGASLMMGQSGTEEAIRLARENPGLAIGWHVHLCDSTPMTSAGWPWGSSPLKAGLRIFFSKAARKLMCRESEVQWEHFQKTGLHCAFVNAHHHLQVHPTIHECLTDLLTPTFSGWLRMGRPEFFSQDPHSFRTWLLDKWIIRGRRRACRYRMSDSIWGVDRTFRMNAEEVADAIRKLGAGLHEFIFHPRKTDGDLDFTALIKLKSMSI